MNYLTDNQLSANVDQFACNETMEKAVAVAVIDPGVLRRMMFATSYLPHDLPKYWEVVASFANQNSHPNKHDVSPDFAKITMENTQMLHSKAFSSDAQL